MSATGNVNNPNFRAPKPEPEDPTLGEITAAVNALKLALQNSLNAGGGKTLKAIIDSKEKALDKIMSKFRAWIQFASGGDETKIRSSGLGVKKQGGATQQLGAVQGLLASVAKNGMEGAIDLNWDPLTGIKVHYFVRMREAVIPGGIQKPWRPAGETGIVTKSKMRVPDLVSGTRYEFEVCGINGKGKGGWSDPAFRVAP